MKIMKVKRAIISVSNKDNLLNFAKFLSSCSVEILSTGGTAKVLKEEGIAVKEVSDFTGMKEAMHGRIKTLHPKFSGESLQEGTMKI